MMAYKIASVAVCYTTREYIGGETAYIFSDTTLSDETSPEIEFRI